MRGPLGNPLKAKNTGKAGKAKANAGKAKASKTDPLDQSAVEEWLAGNIKPQSLDDKPKGEFFTLVHGDKTLGTKPTVRYGVPFKGMMDGKVVIITPITRSGDTVYCFVDSEPYVRNTNPEIARELCAKRTRLALGRDTDVHVNVCEFDQSSYTRQMRYVPCVGDHVISEKGKLRQVRAIVYSWVGESSCDMTCIF